MSKNTPIPTTSVFATSKHNAEEVAEIIKVGLETLSPSGLISRAKVEQAMGSRLTINYNRWWLFVRRAYFQVNSPEVLVDTDAIVAAEKARLEDLDMLSDFDDAKTLGPIAAKLRFEQGYSWGDVMCIMGITEGRARKAFERAKSLKSRGLRNGHGGRFVNNDPTLYLENMKTEGAQFDHDYRGPLERTKALNYVEPEQAPAKKATAKKSAAPAKKSA